MTTRTKRKLVFSILLFLCLALLGICIHQAIKIKHKNDELAAYASGDALLRQEMSDAAVAGEETGYAEGFDAGYNEALQGIASALQEKDATTLSAIRPFFPEQIILSTADGYQFIDIDRSLPQHPYQNENLVIDEDTGIYRYEENGTVTSHLGIDVSMFQGAINWQKVVDAGVEYAWVRGLFRGYGTGELKQDNYFASNMQGAMNAGLKVGVYVYSQAITEAELLEEVNTVLTMVAPYSSDCTIVYDVEKAPEGGRANELTVEERTAFTRLFCEKVAEAGYHPMIYYNMEMSVLMLDLSELAEYDKWFAAYTKEFYYPYDYSVWQYSEKGSIPGVSGEVDLDLVLREN